MVIWWIRRDVRIEDNPALHMALARGRTIPLFILDPHRLQHPAAKRHAFLYDALRQLDTELRRRGSRLVVRQGDPETVLAQMTADTQAEMIFAEESLSPFARRRDDAIASRLPLRLTPGLTLLHPAALLKPDGRAYTTFASFMRAWKAKQPMANNDPVAAPAHLSPVSNDLLSTELPDSNPSGAFPPTAAEARRRLAAFTGGADAPIHTYAGERDRFDRTGTSLLSPFLRFGMLSARQAVLAAHAAGQPGGGDRQGAIAWLQELIWREFCHYILYHFPDVLRQSFRGDMRDIAWANNADDFAAWCEGRTGFPIIDAAMRQLVQTGWMHNRLRLIAASFLVKDLLIDWRWGERFFMEHLIDGDAAANNGGWQWTAGVGADAPPYFRIYSPIAQAKKFDPSGIYVRAWLPELEGVADEYVHTPWTDGDAQQRAAGCIIGHDYPPPIVDRSITRRRGLDVYRAAQTRERAGRESRE